MSIFFDLFSPGNRHRTEELRRLENTREDEAQGEPGRGPIDLNSGTVLIRVPSKQPEASAADSITADSISTDSNAAGNGDAAASEEDGGA